MRRRAIVATGSVAVLAAACQALLGLRDPTAARDVAIPTADGTYLLTIDLGTTAGVTFDLRFLAEVTVDGESLAIELEPLDAGGGGPVAAAFALAPALVSDSADLGFLVDVPPELAIPPAATDGTTGATLDAELFGRIYDATTLCGIVTGQLANPDAKPIVSGTFAAIRIDSRDPPYPRAIVSCTDPNLPDARPPDAAQVDAVRIDARRDADGG